MDTIIDTHKGEYLSSSKAITYKIFHNELIEKVSRLYITIHDSNEEFWGSGGLIEYKINDICIHFIITAAHVIKDICNKTGNAIIKIPFDNLRQDNNNLALTIDMLSLPHIIDTMNDIALIQISSENFTNTGYKFFPLDDKIKYNITENMNVLIFGIPWNRIKCSYRKNRDMQTQQLVVNGFQFPTSITGKKNNSIFLSFPNDVIIYKENSVIKGKNIDPSGLSGSIVWSYESINAYPVGIIVEQNQQKIRCVNMEIIMNLIKKEFAKECNKGYLQ